MSRTMSRKQIRCKQLKIIRCKPSPLMSLVCILDSLSKIQLKMKFQTSTWWSRISLTMSCWSKIEISVLKFFIMLLLKEFSLMGLEMEKVSWFTTMDEFTKGNGWVINDTEKAMSVIQTGTSMRGSLKEAKLMEKEFITGQEERSTMGSGKMEWKKGMGFGKV